MAVTKTPRKNYNTKPDPAGVMYFRDLPPKLKRQFKAECATVGVDMKVAFLVFMRLVKDQDEYVLNRLKEAV